MTVHLSFILLSLIFQQSLDSGSIPDDWKMAHVSPIFKSGNNTSPNNYRPISLTCICSRLLEHILFSRIMTHLNRNNLPLYSRHCFRHKKILSNTIVRTIVTDLHDYKNEQRYTDAILIDFRKAFDHVAHNRLVKIVDNLELDSNTTRWIAEFLTNRYQRVVIKDHTSGSTHVISGVPQGSVLGPLLFSHLH